MLCVLTAGRQKVSFCVPKLCQNGCVPNWCFELCSGVILLPLPAVCLDEFLFDICFGIFFWQCHFLLLRFFACHLWILRAPLLVTALKPKTWHTVLSWQTSFPTLFSSLFPTLSFSLPSLLVTRHFLISSHPYSPHLPALVTIKCTWYLRYIYIYIQLYIYIYKTIHICIYVKICMHAYFYSYMIFLCVCIYIYLEPPSTQISVGEPDF